MLNSPRHSGDISPAAMMLFRFGIIVVFLILAARLYQWQILQGKQLENKANAQRFETIETLPLRGVIYDSQGTILARNRPSFKIALISARIPEDDDTTPQNEEADEIADILRLLHADTDPSVSVRIQDLMFRRLFTQDYVKRVKAVGLDPNLIELKNPNYDPAQAASTNQAPPNLANPDLTNIDPTNIDNPANVNKLSSTLTEQLRQFMQNALKNQSNLSTEISTTGALIDTLADTLTGTGEIKQTSTITVPDTSIPLPFLGVVSLVEGVIQQQRQGGASIPVTILEVDRLQAFEIAEQSYRLPSVRFSEIAVREYVYSELFSHALGFMGPIPREFAQLYQEEGYIDPDERIGLNGLEFSYQDELRGTPGFRNIEVDIFGREMRTLNTRAPIHGMNLWLGIDRRLQRVAYDSLQKTMEAGQAKWGVAIAMNPINGLILSLVSLPSFDNNIFSEGIGKEYFKLEEDKRQPLINYAISGAYPPGSTFKMTTSIGALAEGVVTPDTIIRDDGPLYLPNKFLPDDPTAGQLFYSWNHTADRPINYGPLSLRQALALSNDVYYYQLGGGYEPTQQRGLGNRLLAKWAALFGYGDATGIDLPGEISIAIPNDQWKRQQLAESWTTGDSYIMAIGQGYMRASPLQVLVATSAIANGGRIMQPQVVYQITDSAGGLQRDFKPIVRSELPVPPEMVKVVQEGMRMVVAEGTGFAGQLPYVNVAAKTGDSEFCDIVEEKKNTPDPCRRNDKGQLRTHAWYVAYAPYEAPEIAVVVFIYDGGEGSGSALPVATQILDTYFREIRPEKVDGLQ